jgi:hypothetical protein
MSRSSSLFIACILVVVGSTAYAANTVVGPSKDLPNFNIRAACRALDERRGAGDLWGRKLRDPFTQVIGEHKRVSTVFDSAQPVRDRLVECGSTGTRGRLVRIGDGDIAVLLTANRGF